MMCRRFARCAVLVGVCSAGGGTAAGQVTLGQVDTFQTGAVQGWSVGMNHPAPPAVVATGGPGGAGDQFLRLTALGGGGPGSRLAAFNGEQWAGDYSAAGITALMLDVQNLGAADLFLRLRLSDATDGGLPTNVAVSQAAFVPAGGGWMTISISLASADLTALMGSADGALANTTELRLFHNPVADYPLSGPPPIAAVLGVDNIRAVPAPAGAVVAAGFGAIMAGGRRRERAA